MSFPGLIHFLNGIHSFKFDDAPIAFEATRSGKGTDGKGVIKAVIDGPE
jgi:D-xylulose reductase